MKEQPLVVIRIVLKVAPFGVFGLIDVTVSKFFCAASLIPLGKLIVTTYAAYSIFFTLD
ncbi:cation:dicarboxylase symporter family transporter [Bacillus sp. AFS037270]|uniref:cation:dicarboxylate symporter family transporter n=1 Tax=Bacillus sp. AFS037270 TaxID=2033499 RepID=UPI00350E59C3